MPRIRYTRKLRAPLEQIALAAEESRAQRTRKLKVLSYAPASNRGLQLTPPGSVTFFIARKSASILEAVRTAVGRGGKVDRRLLTRLYEPMARLRPRALAERSAIVKSQPVLAEIRYGGKSLATHLYVNGDDATIVVCPYNGGRFAADGFSLVEYVADGADSALDVAVVARVPPLSKVERAAIDKVAAEDRAINVGPGISEGFPEYIALFLLAVVVGAGVWAAVEHVTNYVNEHNHQNAAAGDHQDAGQQDAGDHAQDFGDAGQGDGQAEGEAQPQAEGERFGLGAELFALAGLTAEEIAKFGPAASASKLVALRRVALLRN